MTKLFFILLISAVYASPDAKPVHYYEVYETAEQCLANQAAVEAELKNNSVVGDYATICLQGKLNPNARKGA